MVSNRERDQAGSSLRHLALVMERVIRLSGILFVIAAASATSLMALLGTVDVIGTKLFNYPIPSTYETTETLMVILIFGGLAYAQLRKRQVRVELLINHLPDYLKALSNVIANLAGIIFFGILTWQSALYFWQSWLVKEVEPSLVNFPIYPAKFIMALGAAIMTLQLVVDLGHAIRAAWR